MQLSKQDPSGVYPLWFVLVLWVAETAGRSSVPRQHLGLPGSACSA
jgi:hypothetical protein